MYADLHCDTLYKCFVDGIGLDDSSLHINLDAASQMLPYIQTFAHYIPENTPDKFDYFCRMLDNSLSIIDSCDRIMLMQSKSDIEKSEKQNKILAVLSVEGGDFFGSNKDDNRRRIEYLERNNIKFLSLCYNSGSSLCGGCHSPIDHGLNKAGYDIAYDLNSHGIILDVSHLGNRSTSDILNADFYALATHSNCRSLCPDSRNLQDEAILRLIERKSLVGINLYSPFLNAERTAGIVDIYRHIEYIKNMGGSENLAFGADFDGCCDLPEQITGLIDIKKLDIGKDILYNNVKRFLLNSI